MGTSACLPPPTKGIIPNCIDFSLGGGRPCPFVIRVDLRCHIPPLGDPKQDLAYERQYEQQTYQVIPEVIKNFIQYFHKTVSDLIDQKVYELQASRVSSDVIDQKVYEIQDIYENRYGPPAEMTSYWVGLAG